MAQGSSVAHGYVEAEGIGVSQGPISSKSSRTCKLYQVAVKRCIVAQGVIFIIENKVFFCCRTSSTNKHCSTRMWRMKIVSEIV